MAGGSANGFMEGIKIDRRTRKTKKAIKNALMDLVTKNDLSKITIKEVSDLADINRKTFYAYYQDVYDVIDEVENEMLEKLYVIIDRYDIAAFLSDPYLLFTQITEFIREDIEFYGNFFKANVSGAILEKVKITIKDKLLRLLADRTTVDSSLLHYSIEYIISGMIAAYREWLASEKKITLEELSRHLSAITANGLHAVMGSA